MTSEANASVLDGMGDEWEVGVKIGTLDEVELTFGVAGYPPSRVFLPMPVAIAIGAMVGMVATSAQLQPK